MGMEWSLQNGEPASRYRKFGCPKCGAKHKFGHKRQYINCYRCWHMFSPTIEGRKYEDERLTNLTPEEREAALKDINSVPPWIKKKRKKAAERKAKQEANRKAKEEAERQAYLALPWYKKVFIYFTK